MSNYNKAWQNSMFSEASANKQEKAQTNPDIVREILSWKPKFPPNRFRRESALEKDTTSSIGSKLRNIKVEQFFSDRKKSYADE